MRVCEEKQAVPCESHRFPMSSGLKSGIPLQGEAQTLLKFDGWIEIEFFARERRISRHPRDPA